MIKFFQSIKALFVKSDVEKTSLQKTARVSIILAAIAIIGVIVYFAVVAPMSPSFSRVRSISIIPSISFPSVNARRSNP